MPVQAFVDESGGKGQAGHFVLAGLIAHADHWAMFSNAWKGCLKQDPAIAYFKMREAASLSGEFHRFNRARRDTKLRSLAKLIDQHAQIATFSVIDLDAHKRTWAKTNEKPLNEPYFFSFHNTILASCFELWDLGWRERFEIIFDEQVILGPRAKAWYPLVRDVVYDREPEAHSIMPVDPLFRADDEFLPLQAADLLAWCCRRRMNIPNGDRRFDWLLEEMPSLEVSVYSQYYDLERLQAVTDEATHQMREGLISTDIIKKYREVFGRS